MDDSTLAILALVGLVAGFVDAIAGGGGLATVPSLRLAGLDPVGVVATNKLCGTFGAFAATFAFWRAGRIRWGAMGPTAALALAGSVAGALALPFAPSALLIGAMPVLLIAVALYFAFAPTFAHVSAGPSHPWAVLAGGALIGFYDGVFGPGAGSFYMLLLLKFGRFGLLDALAGARLANFGSNFGSLAIYALGGHILIKAGLAMGLGNFLGGWLGAHTALKAGAKIVRPLVVVMALALAAKLMMRTDALWWEWLGWGAG